VSHTTIPMAAFPTIKIVHRVRVDIWQSPVHDLAMADCRDRDITDGSEG
jgi:hypothetical protein